MNELTTGNRHPTPQLPTKGEQQAADHETRNGQTYKHVYLFNIIDPYASGIRFTLR